MALQLRIQTTPFGAYTNVDLVAERAASFVYRASYGKPTQLSWVMYQPQQSFPLGVRNFVQFWDDGAPSPFGGTQSASNPLFEGFIEEVQPTDSNLVSITAYDPTYETTRNVTILNLPYLPGVIGSAWPIEQPGSMPRLIYNATIDNDDDFSFCENFLLTVGNVVANVLDFVYQPLYWFNAAWGDGSNLGNGSAYVLSDLTAGAFTFIPQEKETFESEGPRSAVDRLMRYAPTMRLFWTPGSRRWRFYDITAAPTTTLTLNQHDGDPQVLSFELNRSLDNRYTAVRFFGPETSNYTEARLGDGTLTDITPPGSPLESISGHDAFPMTTFQITDPLMRNVCRFLPSAYPVQVGQYSIIYTRTCTVSCYWPETSAGPAGWVAVSGWYVDGHNGIVTFGGPIYRYNPNPPDGSLHYEVPTDVKFVYGVPGSPLQVRYPETGFEGTAYTVGGLTNEMKIYDQMLAVGYQYNNPVTTPTRLAQYSILAQYELALRKDIVYHGGAVLEGTRYEFAGLNLRVNIAAQDGSGGMTTTGWEDIGAYLTDCEIDFDQQTTTLTFSSDQMELVGIDVEGAKQRLKIRALIQIHYSYATFNTTIRNVRISDNQGGFDQSKSIFETNVQTTGGTVFVDPMSGAIDTGMGGVIGPAGSVWRTGQNSVDPTSALRGYLPFGTTFVGEGIGADDSGDGGGF